MEIPTCASLRTARARSMVGQPRFSKGHVLARRFDTIHDVKVVSHRFRPVFPGMCRGVRTDMTLSPIFQRSVAVIALKRLHIVASVIAEECAEGFERCRGPDESVPIKVRRLVSKMAQESSIRLVELHAPLLA